MKPKMLTKVIASVLTASSLLMVFPAMSANQAQDKGRARVDADMVRDRDQVQDREQLQDRDQIRDQVQDKDAIKAQDQDRDRDRDQDKVNQ